MRAVADETLQTFLNAGLTPEQAEKALAAARTYGLSAETVMRCLDQGGRRLVIYTGRSGKKAFQEAMARALGRQVTISFDMPQIRRRKS